MKIGKVDKTYLKRFDSELKYINKAAQFALENILTDVRELEKSKDTSTLG